MALVNGQIDTALLTKIDDTRYLDILAADAWKRVVAEVKNRYGWTPTLSPGASAYRTYEQQKDLFLQRYVPYDTGRSRKWWNGNWWYLKQGAAMAATPGTSNHGWAKALDIGYLGGFNGVRYNQLKIVANKHGFNNREGGSIEEPWHWVYDESEDQHKGEAPEEEDDMPYTPEQITDLVISAFIDMAGADDSHERQGREALKAILAPLIDDRINKVLADTGVIKTRIGGDDNYKSVVRYTSENNTMLRSLTGSTPAVATEVKAQ